LPSAAAPSTLRLPPRASLFPYTTLFRSREQVHVLIVFSQMECNVWNDHAQAQRLNADLLVRVLALRVQERHDIRMVRVQVHRPRSEEHTSELQSRFEPVCRRLLGEPTRP